MILRIDDTDVERNTQESLDSIFEGLKWLGLNWDEFYRQSERGDLHRRMALEIFERGRAYRDFTPAATEGGEKAHSGEAWLFHPGMREISREESDRRAAAGEPFVLRFRVPRDGPRDVSFDDLVYGPQSKLTEDIEDFALLRSSGIPTYHLASCAERCGSADHAYCSRAGSFNEYVQACADLRGAGCGSAEVCASSAADRAGRVEVVEAEARTGGERGQRIATRRVFARGIYQFCGAAGMVAQGQPGEDVVERADGCVHA